MSLKSDRKKNVDDRVGKYLQSVVDLEKKKTGLESTIGVLEFKIKELNIQIDELKRGISKRGERIISLENTEREIEALIESSKGNASQLSKDMHQKIQVSESIIKDKKLEYERIKAQIYIVSNRLDSLAEQAKIVQKERDDVALETERLRNESGELESKKLEMARYLENGRIELASFNEAYRKFNSKKIEMDRREIDLKIYEKRLQKRIDASGVTLKMKLK